MSQQPHACRLVLGPTSGLPRSDFYWGMWYHNESVELQGETPACLLSSHRIRSQCMVPLIEAWVSCMTARLCRRCMSVCQMAL